MRILWIVILIITACNVEKNLPDFSVAEKYIHNFNATDNELYIQLIPNSKAADFLRENIPVFVCPDPDIERTYYFRWWTYRKHIKEKDQGYVITEFLPEVSWAGKYNTISCGLAPHIMEGRWLRNSQYLDGYIDYWCYGGDKNGLAENLNGYSNWFSHALWQRYLVDGRDDFLVRRLPALIKAFKHVQDNHQTKDNLYWSYDVRDGMEESVSGSRTRKNRRATISSYAFGNAKAIALIAGLSGDSQLITEYEEKALQIKNTINEIMWDPLDQFYKVLFEDNSFSKCRELHGYTPWYFLIPEPTYEIAWKQLWDSNGFYSIYGPTTLEQRHPGYSIDNAYTSHKACRWDGPVWPFSTSVTLTALANYLNDATQPVVSKEKYFELVQIYATSHQLVLERGAKVPWIDESLDPRNGKWITRERFNIQGKDGWGSKERGKDYNHSTYCDIIINGLIGVRPAENMLTINPLLPSDTWDWFCLKDVCIRGSMLTVVWDRFGNKFAMGKGYRIFYKGGLVFKSERITKAIIQI